MTDIQKPLTNTTKSALQELLKYGSIEQSHKPNVYQSLFSQLLAVNHALAPLDLVAEVDDVRGLIFVKVAPPPSEEVDSNIDNHNSDSTSSDTISVDNVSEDSVAFDSSSSDSILTDTQQHEQISTPQGDEEDDWTHPLIRKQRLTLEQSLLLAILRQIYIDGEQQQGVGSDNIIAELDDLQSQLQIYTGSSGSDSTDDRRIRTLLEQLANHGVVSKLDNNDEVRIRPLIAHIANPTSLSRLLKHIQELKANDPNQQ